MPTPTVLLDNLMSPWGAPGPNVVAGGRPLLFSDAGRLRIALVAMAGLVVTLADAKARWMSGTSNGGAISVATMAAR